MPTETDLAAWTRMCRADDAMVDELMALLAKAQSLHSEWKQQVRLGLAPIQRNYDDLVRRAQVIRKFEIIYIPGLLQTAEYARSRAIESVRMHGGDPDDIEAAVASRMERQQILYDTSKRFEFERDGGELADSAISLLTSLTTRSRTPVSRSLSWKSVPLRSCSRPGRSQDRTCLPLEVVHGGAGVDVTDMAAAPIARLPAPCLQVVPSIHGPRSPSPQPLPRRHPRPGTVFTHRGCHRRGGQAIHAFDR
jgi:hypothetical protein